MIKVKTYSNWMTSTTDIAFIKEEGDKCYVAEPMVFSFKEVSLDAEIVPTLRIDKRMATQFLQELSNGLNQAGYRSENYEAYKSEITAVKAHLNDMRSIVFDSKADLPNP